MSQEDISLAQRCRACADTAGRAQHWLDANRELVGGEYDALRAELRRSARVFHKCGVAALRKMCVGVFGPSQSGKSYLISALERDERGLLPVRLGARDVDFVTEINPEGGKESTGLVTRFTTSMPEAPPEDAPVHLRLLSESDVAKILANTYYSDCDHKEAPDQKALLETLDRLESRAAQSPAPANNPIDLDELEDLKEYVGRRFQSRPRVQLLDKLYWPRAARLAPLLGLEDRAALFGLIWDQVEAFTALYLRLCGALARLGNPAEARCGLEALLPRAESIIDVSMLRGLEKDNGAALNIRAGQRAITLSRSEVAALTAEITMPVREKPDDYFEHTDLLDFPGYRSRLKIEDLRKELKREGTLENLFLRGKVAYLFERYCAERELTSMLLCIGPGNQEVQDLPGVIDEWVRSTHGESPARRAGKLSSLFFVLTKVDMEFEKKKGSPSVETRWKTRLAASLLDFFGKQHDWPANWDGAGAFNNLFLLRNPNFKCEAIFEFDEQGEVAVRADQIAYVEEIRRAFLATPEVRAHFAEPEKAWDAALALNDGGVAFLREKLRPLCNPGLKREQIATTLADRLDKLRALLSPFRQADSLEEERERREALSRDLARICAGIIQEQRFGEFLRLLQLTDHELYDLYFRTEQELMAREDAPEAANVAGVRVYADELLGDIFGETSSTAASAQAATPAAPARDEAGRFAELVEQYWIERLHALADNPEIQSRFNFPAREFGLFVHELILAAQRITLMRTLEEELRKTAGYGNIARDRLIWKQVGLAAGAINAFVDWLGYNPRIKSAEERTIILKGLPCVLFAPPPPICGYPRIGEEQSPYDRAWYTDWLRALVNTLMDNVQFDGQRIINIEQNKSLKEILQAFAA